MLIGRKVMPVAQIVSAISIKPGFSAPVYLSFGYIVTKVKTNLGFLRR
jgi:hypothetical protein